MPNPTRISGSSVPDCGNTAGLLGAPGPDPLPDGVGLLAGICTPGFGVGVLVDTGLLVGPPPELVVVAVGVALTVGVPDVGVSVGVTLFVTVGVSVGTLVSVLDGVSVGVSVAVGVPLTITVAV